MKNDITVKKVENENNNLAFNYFIDGVLYTQPGYATESEAFTAAKCKVAALRAIASSTLVFEALRFATEKEKRKIKAGRMHDNTLQAIADRKYL